MEKTYSVLFVDDEESILRALERGLIKGLRCEKKEFKPEIFIQSLLSQIRSTEKVDILNFSNKITFTHNILVPDQVAKSILSCAIESFRDDMDKIYLNKDEYLRLKESEEFYKKNIEFEKTIALISSRFISASKGMQESILMALEDMGRLSKADRVYIFFFKQNGRLMDNTYEWCKPGVPPKRTTSGTYLQARFPGG